MSDVTYQTWEELVTAGEALGLVAVKCMDDELILDLDDGAKITQSVLLNMKDTTIYYTTSKSGAGKHAYICWPNAKDLCWPNAKDLSIKEKAAIQACLGSDPLKEFLTFTGKNNFNMMYETEPMFTGLVKWRARRQR